MLMKVKKPFDNENLSWNAHTISVFIASQAEHIALYGNDGMQNFLGLKLFSNRKSFNFESKTSNNLVFKSNFSSWS